MHTFSKKQLLELTKIEEEKNKEYKNNIKVSKETGIPLDIVSLDVTKIGIDLGIINKNSNTTNIFSELLFDNDNINIDFSKIPKNYINYYKYNKEKNRNLIISNNISEQSVIFISLLKKILIREIDKINKVSSFNISKIDINSFKETCLETINVLFDDIEDDIMNIINFKETNEFFKTLEILYVLIQSVFIAISFNEYNILLTKYYTLSNMIKLNNLDFFILNGYISKDFNNQKIIENMVIYNYNKCPKLKPFCLKNTIEDTCTPYILFIDIKTYLKNILTNPYCTSSIVYIKPISLIKTDYYWSFYILRNINSDNTRIWILDLRLKKTFNMINKYLTNYMIKILKKIYYKNFNTNNYINNFWESNHNFKQIMINFYAISNLNILYKIFINTILNNSTIEPTELDFFNHISFYKNNLILKNNIVKNIYSVFNNISQNEVEFIINTFKKYF